MDFPAGSYKRDKKIEFIYHVKSNMYRKSSFLYTLAAICKEIGIFDTRFIAGRLHQRRKIQYKSQNSNTGGTFQIKVLEDTRLC